MKKYILWAVLFLSMAAYANADNGRLIDYVNPFVFIYGCIRECG